MQLKYVCFYFIKKFNKTISLTQVVLNKLQDLQLAIVIVRLYEGDGASLKRLLYEEILGCDAEGMLYLSIFELFVAVHYSCFV